MGAYGNNTCEYCREVYHDLDDHVCEREALKERIDDLLELLYSDSNLND